MNNFKAVYKILSQLEKDLDKNRVDIDKISPEALCVSEQRWVRYLEMMSDVGYIKGVRIVKDISGEFNFDVDEMRITLKGLEYLQENNIMRKLYKTAAGIKEITPGL